MSNSITSSPMSLLGLLVATVLTFAAVSKSGEHYSATHHSGEHEYFEADDIIEHTFKVRPGGQLFLDTERGSVEIEPGSSDEVHVMIERKSRGASQKDMDRLEFSFDEEGDRVLVVGKYDGDRPRGTANKFSVHIKVKVPEKYNVDLHTSGGSISVDDLIGTVEAETSGGSLSFGRIDGPVNGRTSGGSVSLVEGTADAILRTSGGSITLGHVGGTVEAHTSGGSITIEEARGSVVAKTSGGHISVKEVHGAIDASTSGGGITAYISEQPSSDSRLSTGGGSVTVRLNPSLNLNIQAKASGGGVSTDLPITVQGKMTRGRLAGEMNGGGPLLELQTSGGGISLKSIK